MKNNETRGRIVEDLVEAMQEGNLPWRKTWTSSFGLARNYKTKYQYRGINSLMTYIKSITSGYSSPYWGSANSVTQEIGAHVKRGEKATLIHYFNTGSKKTLVDGKEKEDKFFIARAYNVFNLEQFQAPKPESLLDGMGRFSLVKTMLDDKSTRRDKPTTLKELQVIADKYCRTKPVGDENREQLAEFISKQIQLKLDSMKGTQYKVNADVHDSFKKIISGFNPVVERQDKAVYYPTLNKIGMPLKEEFESLEAYYATFLHELGHWIIGNKLVEKKVVDDKDVYAYEELIVEIASCFVCYELGIVISSQPMENTKAYIAHWAKRIGEDPKFIFSAASTASEIANLMLVEAGLETTQEEE